MNQWILDRLMPLIGFRFGIQGRNQERAKIKGGREVYAALRNSGFVNIFRPTEQVFRTGFGTCLETSLLVQCLLGTGLIIVGEKHHAMVLIPQIGILHWDYKSHEIIPFRLLDAKKMETFSQTGCFDIYEALDIKSREQVFRTPVTTIVL